MRVAVKLQQTGRAARYVPIEKIELQLWGLGGNAVCRPNCMASPRGVQGAVSAANYFRMFGCYKIAVFHYFYNHTY
jgi:hypothetical protein